MNKTRKRKKKENGGTAETLVPAIADLILSGIKILTEVRKRKKKGSKKTET